MDDATRIATLDRLAGLYRAGNLTAEEYAAQKTKLLNADDADGSLPAEKPVEQFHGSTAGWLFGSGLGWLAILLILSPILAFALTDSSGVRYASLALLVAACAAIGSLRMSLSTSRSTRRWRTSCVTEARRSPARRWRARAAS